MSVLSTNNLTFGFGSKPVLNGITFSADRGAFVGIVGPNGSGKTSLLKIMHGIYRPTSGMVDLIGKNLSAYSAKQLATIVAGVSQRPVFSFPFRVEQLVLLGRTPYMTFLKVETSRDRGIALEAMRQTDTLMFAKRPISELSAGELQRVCVAAALAQQPRVLLLDEPTSFLDLRQAAQLSRLLRKLQRTGMTILCASHDLRFLKQQATAILLLNEGHQLGFGDYNRILSDEMLTRVFGIDGESDER